MRRAVLALSILFLGLAAAPPSFTVDQILDFPSRQPCRVACWIDHRLDVQRARRPEHLCRRSAGFQAAPAHAVHRRRRAGTDATCRFQTTAERSSTCAAAITDPTGRRRANPSGIPFNRRFRSGRWRLPGSAPKLLGEGDDPAIAPDGTRVAFVRDRRIWLAPIDGSKQAGSRPSSPAAAANRRSGRLTAGRSRSCPTAAITASSACSPGSADSVSRAVDVAGFVAGLVPATDARSHFCASPAPAARRARRSSRPGRSGPILVAQPDHQGAPVTAVTSGDSPVDPILQNPGGIRFRWAADDTLVFMSYRDGWPHLYSLDRPGTGTRPLLLTPGSFMVEQMTLTPDGRSSSTTRIPDPIAAMSIAAISSRCRSMPQPRSPLTTGTGIEWSPVVTADGQTVAFLTADAQAPAVSRRDSGLRRADAADWQRSALRTSRPRSSSCPSWYRSAPATASKPTANCSNRSAAMSASPPSSTFTAADRARCCSAGTIAGNTRTTTASTSTSPAAASLCCRSITGSASDTARHFSSRTARARAALPSISTSLPRAITCRTRPDVDPRASASGAPRYGGYLTALALGRNSDVFAAGVDIHGVHDRLPAINPTQLAQRLVGDGLTEADLRQALKVHSNRRRSPRCRPGNRRCC